jgi:hypothetical protein
VHIDLGSSIGSNSSDKSDGGSVFDFIIGLLGLDPPVELADRVQVVSAVVAVIGAIVAIAAAGIALWQVKAARSLQRETLARQMYTQYLELCFENPEYASADHKATANTEKYEWFISVMLNAAEGISMFVPNDDEWRQTLKDQIGYHSDFIGSDAFQQNVARHYGAKMRNLIDEALDEARQRSRGA